LRTTIAHKEKALCATRDQLKDTKRCLQQQTEKARNWERTAQKRNDVIQQKNREIARLRNQKRPQLAAHHKK
jgi:uncharacterized protein (DUF3084 family)